MKGEDQDLCGSSHGDDIVICSVVSDSSWNMLGVVEAL